MTMTTRSTTKLRDELDDVREAWQEWTEKWQAFQWDLRHAGYDTDRLDAYMVGMGSDEGGGQSMEGWLDEIAADLTPEGDETDD